MHDTARLSGYAFFRVYGDPLQCPRILDVGSLDVNGTLRPLAPKDCEYIGVDTRDGLNVDVVLEQPYPLPFENHSFDIVISTSCLEHDPIFWETFSEMVRVIKPGGFLYISVPAEGPYHAHPIDCWRFNSDAASALVKWHSRSEDNQIVLIETFMVLPIKDAWTDNVMVFGVPPVTATVGMRARLHEMHVSTI